MRNTMRAIGLAWLAVGSAADAGEGGADAVAMAYWQLPLAADLTPGTPRFGGLFDLGSETPLATLRERPPWFDLRFTPSGYETLHIHGRGVDDWRLMLEVDRETDASEYAAVAGVVAIAALTGTLIAVSINSGDDDDDRPVPSPPPAP